MPRIRTIKPEFWSDEKLSVLDPLTRLVFLGLVSNADDHGRLIDNLKSLDGLIFPHTDDSCKNPLEILARLSRILRYTAKSGQKLIQIVGWKNHQKVDHPARELLPAPTKEDWSKPVASQRVKKPRARTSRKSRDTLARTSRTISTTNDLRPTTSTNDLFADSGESDPKPNGVYPPPKKTERLSQDDTELLRQAWGKRIGVVPFPRFRKEILPIFDVPEGARPPVKDVLAAIEAYGEWWVELDDREQGFNASVPKFVAQLAKFMGFGKMPLTINGELTERGSWAGSKSLRQQRAEGRP